MLIPISLMLIGLSMHLTFDNDLKNISTVWNLLYSKSVSMCDKVIILALHQNDEVVMILTNSGCSPDYEKSSWQIDNDA